MLLFSLLSSLFWSSYTPPNSTNTNREACVCTCVHPEVHTHTNVLFSAFHFSNFLEIRGYEVSPFLSPSFYRFRRGTTLLWFIVEVISNWKGCRLPPAALYVCVCFWTRRKIHNIDRLFPLNVACMCAYYAPPNCLCCHYMLCFQCDIRCGTWTNKKFIVHYRTSRCCRQSQWRWQHINYLLYATRNMVHRSLQRKRDVRCSTTLCHCDCDTRQTSLPIYCSIDRNVASIAKKTHRA